MLKDLGCRAISRQEAALRLARQLAQRLLDTGEDPLPLLPYFNKLMLEGEYPSELSDLEFLEDHYDLYSLFYSKSPEKEEVRARGALEELLSPELQKRRKAEREAVQEQFRMKANAFK